MTLLDRLIQALEAEHVHISDLIAGDRDHFSDDGPDLVDAAVLVAFTDRPEPGIILTQRPQTMRKHAGQVAFPGGRVDAEDQSLVAAALREAEEEIGLNPHLAQIVGVADQYRTVTHYRVTPVLAVIPPDLEFVANDGEVEAVFEVPAQFLFDPANHQRQTVQWEGQDRSYHEMHWEDRRMWGATAAMIVNLSKRLKW